MRLIILIQAVMLILPATGAISAGDTLSLDECIELALKNNPTVIVHREALYATEMGVTVSRSPLLPKLDASSGYTKSGDGTATESYSSSVTLSQTLFQGGRNLSAVSAARAQSEIARQNLNLTENRIAESVKEGFYSVIQKQERLALTQAVLKRRKEDLVLVRLKYRAGIESEAAVSEGEANFAEAEYDKMSAEEELRLAKLSLNLLMGRSKETAIEVEKDVRLPDFPSRNDAVAIAAKSRPEIAQAEARVTLQKAYLSQSRASFLPNLNLNASLGRHGEEFLSGEDSWSAGVRLSLPLFDGFRTPAGYLQSRAGVRQQNAQYEDTKRTVEEDVEKAYSQWLVANKRMEVAEKNLSAATAMYDLTRLQYQQGTVAHFIFQQRELSLTQAEYERVTASYSMLAAAARLENALGRPSSVTPRGKR